MNLKERLSSKGSKRKFLQSPLVQIVLGFLLLVIVTKVAQTGTETWPGHNTNLANLLSALIAVSIISLAYYGFIRLIERRAVTELALSPAVKELAAGTALGAFLFSVTIGILWVLGFYQVSGINGWAVVVTGLVPAIFSGVFEELLFRGIIFRVIEQSLGSWLALAISALLFGALHLANPNATLWGAITIAIEAGIMLAAAFVFTRRLWLPIGIHFAWNFTQGTIFGVAVSGNDMKGLLQSTLSGPALLSGGAFGAEASIFAVLVCLLAGGYLIWQSLRRGKFIPPFWARTS